MTPPRVDDVEAYWTNPPPEKSARLVYWERRVAEGWRRNRRISSFGYYESAEFFGVYIWEWTSVLWPLLTKEKDDE